MSPRLPYHRSKLLFILALLVAGLTLLTLWESHNRKQLVSSFDTMYADRLVPASELYHLTDLMYERRRVAADFIISGNTKQAREEIRELKGKMDSILTAYEKTYLVSEETAHLPVYKRALTNYSQRESDLLRRVSTMSALEEQYDAVRAELLALSDIQLQVGKKLAQGQHSLNGSMNLLNLLRSCLLLGLAVLIIMLIRDFRSSTPRIRQDHINLN